MLRANRLPLCNARRPARQESDRMTQTQSAADAAADEARGSGFAAEMERDRAHREKAKSARPLRRLVP